MWSLFKSPQFLERVRPSILIGAICGMVAGAAESTLQVLGQGLASYASGYIIQTTLQYALFGIVVGLFLWVIAGLLVFLRGAMVFDRRAWLPIVLAVHGGWIALVTLSSVGGHRGASWSTLAIPVAGVLTGAVGLYWVCRISLHTGLGSWLLDATSDMGVLAVVVLGFLVAASPFMLDNLLAETVTAKTPGDSVAQTDVPNLPDTRLEVLARKLGVIHSMGKRQEDE